VNPEEYNEIKIRHGGASDVSEPVVTEHSEPKWKFETDDPDTADFIQHAHSDMAKVLDEHERFKSNYEAGLDWIDNFMLMHGAVIPDKVRFDARALQAQMRGLL
jgi:hypothetical protein